MTHIHTCNVIYSYVTKKTSVYQPRARHPPIYVTWLTFTCATSHIHACAAWRIFIHAKWYIFICEKRNLCVSTKSSTPLHMCDMTHIHMYNMVYSYALHNPESGFMCDTTHSYVKQETYLYQPRGWRPSFQTLLGPPPPTLTDSSRIDIFPYNPY